jgi:hypothetical protein
MDEGGWERCVLSFVFGCGYGVLALIAGFMMLMSGNTLGSWMGTLLWGPAVFLVGERYVIPTIVLMYGGFACFLARGTYPTSRLTRAGIILGFQASSIALSYML